MKCVKEPLNTTWKQTLFQLISGEKKMFQQFSIHDFGRISKSSYHATREPLFWKRAGYLFHLTTSSSMETEIRVNNNWRNVHVSGGSMCSFMHVKMLAVHDNKCDKRLLAQTSCRLQMASDGAMVHCFVFSFCISLWKHSRSFSKTNDMFLLLSNVHYTL